MRIPRFIFMLAIVSTMAVGCSPNAQTASEEDIEHGDAKLGEIEEMQTVEGATHDDYDKMTRVDPNLKQEAMADYTKAIQDDPSNPEAYYARGFAQLSHGESMEKAVADFTKAIELKPDFAQAYLMRGRAYEALGDREQAKSDRNKALELNPEID